MRSKRKILQYARRTVSTEIPRPELRRFADGFEVEFPDEYYYRNERWTGARILGLVVAVAAVGGLAFFTSDLLRLRGFPYVIISGCWSALLIVFALLAYMTIHPIRPDPDSRPSIRLDSAGTIVRYGRVGYLTISRARLIDVRVEAYAGTQFGYLVLEAVSPTALREASGPHAHEWPPSSLGRSPTLHKGLDGQLLVDLLRVQRLFQEALPLPRDAAQALKESMQLQPTREESEQYRHAPRTKGDRRFAR